MPERHGLDALGPLERGACAQVSVRPSGRGFLLRGGETLLEGALRAGLRVNYGCGDGSCGLCKARVVAGRVRASCAPAYRLSQAERQQGYALLCAHVAASPELVLETLEATGPQDIPDQRITARVGALTPMGPETVHLHLHLPRRQRLRFLAGQTVTLGTVGPSAAQGRYPIASCPCDDRNLHFYLADNPADRFASGIFSRSLRPGDDVEVCGPYGDFVLADGNRPLVFVACDLGIGPIKGLIEHAIAVEVESASLYWLATRPDGHFLAQQCRAWDEALDEFAYSLHTAADLRSGAGQVLSAMQADLFLDRCAVYIAGPARFVQALVPAMHDIGVPRGQIRSAVLT